MATIDEDIVSAEMAPAGIIEHWLKNNAMSGERIIREFLDNSLDAGANEFVFTRDKLEMCVRDDGCGCPDPKAMLTPGYSRRHGDGARSGYFGLGCKIGAIRGSAGQMTAIETVHDGVLRKMVADWKRIIRRNRLEFTPAAPSPAPRGMRGTLIRCYGRGEVYRIREPEKIAEKLGFDYADVIAAGKRIILDIDGRRIEVAPFVEPRFSERVDFEFDYEGETIRGYCGLVADGERNDHPGWTFHRPPHRTMLTKREPGGGRYVGRIRGRVDLPAGWGNVNVTKDDFSDEPEDLYRIIGEKCERIIELADRASMDFELNTFTSAVVDRLNGLVLPFVKGRRDRTGENPGSVEPKGTDRRHKLFGKHQPGEKGFPADSGDVPRRQGRPRFRIHWDANLPYSHTIQIPGHNGVVAEIALNPEHPIPGGLKQQQDPAGLAAWCLMSLASYLCINKEYQKYIGIYDGEENVNVVLDKLIGRDGSSSLRVAASRCPVSAGA